MNTLVGPWPGQESNMVHYSVSCKKGFGPLVPLGEVIWPMGNPKNTIPLALPIGIFPIEMLVLGSHPVETCLPG
jgi:hypothetical protein